MNEINKLYENAGIESEWRYTVHQFCHFYEADKEDILRNKYLFKERKTARIKKAEKKYPPFTAEKQIEVENIIFQCNFGICELQRTMPAEFTKDNRFVKHYFAWQYHAGDIDYSIEEPYEDWDVEYTNPDRKEALAGFVNALWDEYLTEEERKQIRNILVR